MKRVLLGEWKVEKHKFSFKEENRKSDGLISFYYDEDSLFPFSAHCAYKHTTDIVSDTGRNGLYYEV